jgi:hypothetical protein
LRIDPGAIAIRASSDSDPTDELLSSGRAAPLILICG